MRIVSPVLKRVVYPLLAKAGVFRRSSAAGLAVVTYHGILPAGYEPVDPALDGNLITADAFRRQLRLLKAHYKVISPEDMRSWRENGRDLPPRAVLLTCDDGLLNNLTDMLPILEEEKLRCLFFVTGASAGDEPATLWYEDLFLIFLRAPAGNFTIRGRDVEVGGILGTREQRLKVWWSSVQQLSRVGAESRATFLYLACGRFGVSDSCRSPSMHDPAARRFKLLTGTELRGLRDAGMTIGAHTLTHPMLSQLPHDLARTEIAESRIRLEAALEKEVWALAYPFGDPASATSREWQMAEQAGFQCAFMNVGGGLGAALPTFALPRVHVTSETGLAEFEAHVSGFYGALRARLSGDSPE
jgi:peptidoglycan/xylan/chitin deacetylase (PgdA/CDA1 family)